MPTPDPDSYADRWVRAWNRHDIEALCQYLHEQGLTDRKVALEELFVPAAMDMSKV